MLAVQPDVAGGSLFLSDKRDGMLLATDAELQRAALSGADLLFARQESLNVFSGGSNSSSGSSGDSSIIFEVPFSMTAAPEPEPAREQRTSPPPDDGQLTPAAANSTEGHSRKCSSQQSGDESAGLPVVPEAPKTTAMVVTTADREPLHGGLVHPLARPFTASPALGLVGHVENIFIAAYIRDLNNFIPMTSEGAVMSGMLEAMVQQQHPHIPQTGKSLVPANAAPAASKRRSAKLAVFWGVVALGSRILGAPRADVERYRAQVTAALRDCFDEDDPMVVQAYLLLGSLETMLGNCPKARRYMHFAKTVHASLRAKSVQEQHQAQLEGLETLLQVFGARMCECDAADEGPCTASGANTAVAAAACSEMLQSIFMARTGQAVKPMDALRLTLGMPNITRKVLDPESPCPIVLAHLHHLENACDGVGVIINTSSVLTDCVAIVAPQMIWHGITLSMSGRIQAGLKEVAAGMELAMSRPGLMTFPLWWHCMHCAAITLQHHDLRADYDRFKAVFDNHCYPGTQLPPFDAFNLDHVCGADNLCRQYQAWLLRRMPRDDQGVVHGINAECTGEPALAEEFELEDVDMSDLMLPQVPGVPVEGVDIDLAAQVDMNEFPVSDIEEEGEEDAAATQALLELIGMQEAELDAMMF
eukprot:TRINITY_DN2566_c0_g1_i1.p1 TRINITY_DN2566_c0_g1~~TRINITY_DN2566_c0_g1_i1.p1  ORF type:complete len:646 (+),score=231.25 TRINITY_DN2566_c0_g1_i1:316-2253(+)